MIFFPAQQDYSMELYASMHSIILQHLQIFVTEEHNMKPRNWRYVILNLKNFEFSLQHSLQTQKRHMLNKYYGLQFLKTFLTFLKQLLKFIFQI